MQNPSRDPSHHRLHRVLGRVPIGAKILPFTPATDWIMSVLNVGGQRRMIAGAIGFIAVSLRIIVGLERRAYGGE